MTGDLSMDGQLPGPTITLVAFFSVIGGALQLGAKPHISPPVLR
jgi:hypothetical protein